MTEPDGFIASIDLVRMMQLRKKREERKGGFMKDLIRSLRVRFTESHDYLDHGALKIREEDYL